MAAVLALGAAACGGPSGPQTYLASDSSSVLLVQWQPGQGNAIQGTITYDSITGTAPGESVSVNSAPFTGTINGSSMIMTINGGFLAGTLNGSTLTISSLGSSGAIQASTLNQSSTSAYNQAVATLHKSTGQARPTPSPPRPRHGSSRLTLRQSRPPRPTSRACGRPAISRAT